MIVDVVFRVDASPRLGAGHLTRCLTLAAHLKRNGARVKLLMRPIDAGAAGLIAAAGMECVILTPDSSGEVDERREFDWQADVDACVPRLRTQRRPLILVVDHYDLDARWEKRVRPEVDRLVVIDDLANRAHECDWLLDQTFGRDVKDYAGLVPDGCRFLLGAEFCLLRPQFAKARAATFFRPGSDFPRTLHLFFGSSDVRSNTPHFAGLILENFPNIAVKVALGRSVPSMERALDSLAKIHWGRLTWDKGISDMAAHITGCDVAVGAPGITTWERACLGVPGAYVAISENQEPLLEALALSGFCVYLGRDSTIDDVEFIERTRYFLNDHQRLAQMRATGLAAIDGLGIERVVRLMFQIECTR